MWQRWWGRRIDLWWRWHGCTSARLGGELDELNWLGSEVDGLSGLGDELSKQ